MVFRAIGVIERTERESGGDDWKEDAKCGKSAEWVHGAAGLK